MSDNELMEQIDATVKENQIVIFMKGSPMQPACGFSAAASEILKATGRPFAYVDVFEIPGVRDAIKQYTQWPTIPQIFINGEFVGGTDILREMSGNGELDALLATLEPPETAEG